MSETTNKVITVIGPIGAGKTTITKLLSDKLKLPLIDADLYDQNPFLPHYIKDTPRWAFTTELFFTTKRIKKLSILAKMLKSSSVIVDSGLIMSHHVYTKNHLVQGTMTANEWDFFSEIIQDYKKSIPEPDIIIQLTANPKTQMERIKKRGRSFEADYTMDYLHQITDRLDEYARSMNNHPHTTLLTFSTENNILLTPKGELDLITQVKNPLTSP